MEFDYIKALNKEKVSRTPIWIMRQAGRYLPEYRATRKKAGDFMSLCKNPEFATEVVLQPLQRYDLDAAILFSDILTIPDAMGLELYFVEGEGPKFKKPIKDPEDIKNLTNNVNDELSYVFDAVSSIKKALNNKLPLIGFSGSPWTLATYMIEGGSSKNFHKAKKMLYNNPKEMHLLLDKLSDSIINYLHQQVLSGADSLMIFDTWGGALNKEKYLNFSLHYMNKIVKKIKELNPNIPITLFSKNGGKYLENIAQTNCSCIGLDWTIEIDKAKEIVGNKVALQGNLDPAVLACEPNIIEREAKKILEKFNGNTGHIFNLGHGITPDISPEKLTVLIDTVHNFKS